MSQGSVTIYDICRHLGLKTQKGRVTQMATRPLLDAPYIAFVPEGTTTYGCGPAKAGLYFFVAVIADGAVSVMVLPLTVPLYFVFPAVNSIAAPRRRP